MRRESEVLELLEHKQENDDRAENIRAGVTTITVVHDVEELSSLHDEWNNLVVHSDATVFQTHEWLSRWWKYFGHAKKCRLHILLFRQEGTLVGIAPFFIETQSLFGITLFKRMRLMGCGVTRHPLMANDAEGGPSDYLDIIALKGHEQAVGSLISNYLAEHASIFQTIDLENLREEGTLYRFGVPALRKKGFKIEMKKADVCPFLPVPRSIDEYGQSLTPEVRRRWRRARKDFDGTRIRSIHESDSPEELRSAFKDLVFLHQLRWNRLGYLGLFADTRYEAFQEDVAEAFRHRGWLWFKSAHAGGICVASQMVFVFNKRVYGYLSGFDDRSPWAKSRPGLALYAAVIEDAVQSKLDVVDFLRGAEQYKFDLTSSTTYNWNVTASRSKGFNRFVLFASFVSGRLIHLLRKSIKELLIMNVFAREYGKLMFIKYYIKFVLRRLSHSTTGRSSGTASKKERGTMRLLLGTPERVLRKISSTVFGQYTIARARIHLRNCDSVGSRAFTRARPVIVNHGKISIGKDFTIHSYVRPSELRTEIQGTIEIGSDVQIDYGCVISAQKLVQIGNHVRIGCSVMISDTGTPTHQILYPAVNGESIVIEDDVVVESNVTIVKGVRIGKGSVIKKGSTVSESVPPHVVAEGVPARAAEK